MAQLSARGVSIIVSAGDSGVGSTCAFARKPRFIPRFPASCPWVTSVGATQQVIPEIAAPYSSGGFSKIFLRPSHQEQAVQTYINRLGSRWKGLFNDRGRGFPDVSVQGFNIMTVVKGIRMIQRGTSAATPAFAGMVALLNGQAPLGFLSPLLYSPVVPQAVRIIVCLILSRITYRVHHGMLLKAGIL
jgi:tripeptidyl-peptidase I